MFHSELRELFYALKYRGDRGRLLRLFEENDNYRHLSPDTAETMMILLKIPDVWERREEYMSRKEQREEYDMCQALREWREEGRAEGMAQGLTKGMLEKTTVFVQNMLKRGFSDEEICELAECSVEFIDRLR